MLLACLTCGARIRSRWLFLALPWTRYRCLRCGSVFEGTLLRLALTSVAAGAVGYVLIAVVKARANPLVLIPSVAVGFALFTLRLPGQIKKVS